MITNEIKNLLRKYLDNLEIIDAHEHFTPEEYHLTTNYNFFNWMIPYIQFDLANAGMSPEFMWNAAKAGENIEKCWSEFAKAWKYVKHGTYARACLKALKEFYGFDDITEDNYKLIGEKMNATRYDGRYKEILFDRCHIKYMLNQTGSASYKDSYMKGSYQAVNKINGSDIAGFIEKNPAAKIEDYLAAARVEILDAAKQGAVLVKYDTTSFITELNEEKAKDEFEQIRQNGAKAFKYPSCLSTYLFEKFLDITQEAKLVAAVHTGVWGDITKKNPEILFSVVERHPNLVFDVYHMGMPYVRECAFLGKNYPNVYLNLCWSFIVSQEMAENALSEWIDLVPTNKIIGFGGDFATMPENIWAHLEMAKETFVEVFGSKIEKGYITLDEAKFILKQWLFENPSRVYNLK